MSGKRVHAEPAPGSPTSGKPNAPAAKPKVPLVEVAEPRLASRSIRTLCMLIVFRVVNALSIATFFNPDEYWQSLEVAYVWVYKYGFLTWEWMPGLQLRGGLFPLFYAAGFKLLKYLHVDHTQLLIALPRIQQGVLVAFCDYYTYRLAYLFFGRKVARWTLFASLVSWFNFFSLPRTFSNNVEATLVVASLYYWHCTPARYMRSILLMGLTVVLRPTSVPVYAIHLLFALPPRRHFVSVMILIILVAIPMLVGSILIDNRVYDYLYRLLGLDLATMPLDVQYPYVGWNFLNLNILKKVAVFYGSHPWHWYFSNGVPTMLGPFLLALPFGTRTWIRSLAAKVALLTVSLFSLLSHKELRFVSCVYPMFLMAVGLGMKQLADPESEASEPQQKAHGAAGKATKTQQPQETSRVLVFSLRTRRGIIGVMVLLSWALAYYTTRIHQRGVIDVMYHLRQEAARWDKRRRQQMGGAISRAGDKPIPDMSVYFLMPCHSTPLYSYLAQPIRTGWMTCQNHEARLPGTEASSKSAEAAEDAEYLDEADQFYADIAAGLKQWDWRERWGSTWTGRAHAGSKRVGVRDGAPATHIVAFDTLVRPWKSVGVLENYKECARFFNSHFHDDRRREGDVVVLCRSDIAT